MTGQRLLTRDATKIRALPVQIRFDWKTSILLFLLMFGFAWQARALDDRICMFPPTGDGGKSLYPLQNGRWDHLVYLAENALEQAEAIPIEQIVATWEGDTLRTDLWAIDIGIAWGEQLDADWVVLTEWNDDQVSMHAVNPWEGETHGPVTAQTSDEALQLLFPEKFIYGLFPPPPGHSFTPPELADGSRAVHTYMHENRVYPPDAAIQGIAASADVRVTVNADGVPLAVELVKVSPPDWGFDETFEQAMWSVKWKPGTYDGKPVSAVFNRTVQVHFVP